MEVRSTEEAAPEEKEDRLAGNPEGVEEALLKEDDRAGTPFRPLPANELVLREGNILSSFVLLLELRMLPYDKPEDLGTEEAKLAFN